MKKNHLHYALYLLLVVTISSGIIHTLLGQSQYRFKNYTTEYGLPPTTNDIAQDSLGFMWFLHTYAISRFDGYTFKTYRHDPDDPLMNLGAGNLGYGRFMVDPKGDLWLNNMVRDIAQNCILHYDRKLDGFIRYQPDLKGALVEGACFDKKTPSIWLGGRKGRAVGKGLFHFNLETQATDHYLNQQPDKDVHNRSNFITGIKDYDSILLLTTHEGLWKFNKSNGKFTRPKVNARDSLFLYHSIIEGLMPVEKNQYWLVSPSGLFKLDPGFSVIQQFHFSPGFVHGDIDITKAGIIWVATQWGGFFRFDPSDNSFVNIKHVPDDPSSLPDNNLWTVSFDRDENLWATPRDGAMKMQTPELTLYNTKLNQGIAIICKIGNTLFFGKNNRKWGPGGYPAYNTFWSAPFALQDSISFQPFKYDTQPHGGLIYRQWQGKRYLWYTVWYGGVIGFPLNPLTGLPEGHPTKFLLTDPKNRNTITTDSTCAVWEDEDENLWVGSGHGLNIISPNIPYGESGSVKRYRHNPNDTNSLLVNFVRAIKREDKNNVWVATEAGVDLFDGNRFLHVFKNRERVSSMYKASDGTIFIGTQGGLYEGKKENGSYLFVRSKLITDPIAEEPAFAEDKSLRLWIVMSDGSLICYDRNQNIAPRLTEQDGLIISIRLTKAPDGIFIINNENAFSMFDPMSLQISNTKTNPVFTQLTVNNLPIVIGNRPVAPEAYASTTDITVLNKLVLDYQHNHFSVEFSAMEMTAPEKNLYRHKLDGYDKDWIETNCKSRTATYTNLDAGTYTFRVKASNHHGIWSDNERTLQVVILPPPWRTWWAYAGYLMLVAGALVVARKNIVQRERLKANLQLAKVEQEKEHIELEKAQEVDRVKTSFFTNISHEFRTPLTLIKGPVQNLLEEFADNPKVRDRLKLVERNSDLLLRLINQLLDLAKLESGSLKVEKTEGELYSFIRAIASSFESFARQKNISIEVDVSANKCSALFDKDKLETILINLINNAIKFTTANGSVTVEGHVNETAGAQGRNGSLTLKVSDTGIGIPEEQQTKIFERFHQVSEAHKEVGTGIGLALVKELVTLMGGEIGVTSEVNKGSEFKIVLPIEVTSRQTTSSWPTGQAGGQTTLVEVAPSLERMSNDEFPRLPVGQGMMNNEVDSTKPHVLVVEDNTDLRHFIIDSLGNEFNFLEAENGVQGLEKATTEIPDLIISDVMMPEMDGITMAGKIKTDIRTSHIPLILLTAKSSEDSKLSGLSSGADDYLTKPFNKNELLLKVRNGVNRQLKLRERLRAELMSTAPKVEVLSEDEKFLNSVKEKILERLSDEQLSVESLADDMGMSRVQLYRKVSGLTGISVNELIRKLRLQRAAQLLQQKWGPVSQVAYEVGFSNLSYFSKVFKEEFGTLPSEYV